MKKYLFAPAFMFFLAFTPVVFAAPCDQANETLKEAQNKQLEEMSEIYDEVTDPKDHRNASGSCLDIVMDMGSGFDMGAMIPSIDSIIEGVCQEVNSQINQQISNITGKVKSQATGQLGELKSKFNVNGNPASIAKDALGGLKK